MNSELRETLGRFMDLQNTSFRQTVEILFATFFLHDDSVEVIEVREDKPITKLVTTVKRDDGTVVLEGTAVCYTFALP